MFACQRVFARKLNILGRKTSFLVEMASENNQKLIASLSTSVEFGNLTNLGLLSSHKYHKEKANLLVVGDGNLSYTLSLTKSLQQLDLEVDLLSTTYDTLDELVAKYPKCSGILQQLLQEQVKVQHGIDATAVSIEELGGKLFDRIVFNFPHYAKGGTRRNRIHLHRQLLAEFFQNVKQLLAPKGQVWVTLCAGQGGSPAEIIKRPWGDTWQVADKAAESGLLLLNAHFCPTDQLAALGYYSVGYLQGERGFHTESSLSHVFCFDNISEKAQFPLQWTRDISFWVREDYSLEKFHKYLRIMLGDGISATTEVIDDYTCPNTRQVSTGIRLTLESTIVALSKSRVNKLCEDILEGLHQYDLGYTRGTERLSRHLQRLTLDQ